MYHYFGKRLIDVFLVLLSGPLWVPVCAIIALSVRLKLGTPVLFRQERPGKGGELFTLVKFRTMNDARDDPGNLLPDEQRLTRFGRLLRSTSLDELPSLWNILRGEMSLVGPRPLLSKYLPLYNAEQSRRHEVRPGLTGLAQVSGRNALDWETRFRLDVSYADRCCIWLDLWILGCTVFRVIKRDGISAENHATSPEFEGSLEKAGMVVIGAGGHAKVVIATLQANRQRVATVYDDQPRHWGQSMFGIPIQGPISELSKQARRDGVIAIGDNRLRKQFAAELNLNWVGVVHPAAQVHESARIGPGSAVFAGAIIQPDTTIGVHSIINTSASVDHDCTIGDFVHLGPGSRLAGNVTVGDGVMLGIGSVVMPGITIGRNTIVGAGAVVINDLPADVTAVGCPARVLNQQTDLRKAS